MDDSFYEELNAVLEFFRQHGTDESNFNLKVVSRDGQMLDAVKRDGVITKLEVSNRRIK